MELLDALPADDPQATPEFVIESRREAVGWASDQIRPEFTETTWLLFWQIRGRSRTLNGKKPSPRLQDHE